MTALNRPGYWGCVPCTAHNRTSRSSCGVCGADRDRDGDFTVEEFLRRNHARGIAAYGLHVLRTEGGRLFVSIAASGDEQLYLWLDDDTLTRADEDQGGLS